MCCWQKISKAWHRIIFRSVWRSNDFQADNLSLSLRGVMTGQSIPSLDLDSGEYINIMISWRISNIWEILLSGSEYFASLAPSVSPVPLCPSLTLNHCQQIHYKKSQTKENITFSFLQFLSKFSNVSFYQFITIKDIRRRADRS